MNSLAVVSRSFAVGVYLLFLLPALRMVSQTWFSQCLGYICFYLQKDQVITEVFPTLRFLDTSWQEVLPPG